MSAINNFNRIENNIKLLEEAVDKGLEVSIERKEGNLVVNTYSTWNPFTKIKNLLTENIIRFFDLASEIEEPLRDKFVKALVANDAKEIQILSKVFGKVIGGKKDSRYEIFLNKFKDPNAQPPITINDAKDFISHKLFLEVCGGGFSDPKEFQKELKETNENQEKLTKYFTNTKQLEEFHALENEMRIQFLANLHKTVPNLAELIRDNKYPQMQALESLIALVEGNIAHKLAESSKTGNPRDLISEQELALINRKILLKDPFHQTANNLAVKSYDSFHLLNVYNALFKDLNKAGAANLIEKAKASEELINANKVKNSATRERDKLLKEQGASKDTNVQTLARIKQLDEIILNAENKIVKNKNHLTPEEFSLILEAKQALMQIQLNSGHFTLQALLSLPDRDIPAELKNGLKDLLKIDAIRGERFDTAMIDKLIKDHESARHHPHVGVEGGGPTGLFLAITQFQAGAKVSLFEARSALYERTQIVRLDPKWMAMLKFYLGEKYYQLFEDVGKLGILREDGFGEIAILDLEAALHTRLTELMSMTKSDANGKLPLERLAAHKITGIESPVVAGGKYRLVASYEESYDMAAQYSKIKEILNINRFPNVKFEIQGKMLSLKNVPNDRVMEVNELLSGMKNYDKIVINNQTFLRDRPPTPPSKEQTKIEIDMLISAGGKNSMMKEKFFPTAVSVTEKQNYAVASWLSDARQQRKPTPFVGQNEQFNMFDDFRGMVKINSEFLKKFDSYAKLSLIPANYDDLKTKAAYQNFLKDGPQNRKDFQTRTFENLGLIYVGMEMPNELYAIFESLPANQAKLLQKAWFQTVGEVYKLDQHGAFWDKIDDNFIASFPVDQHRVEDQQSAIQVKSEYGSELVVAAAGDSHASPHFMRYSGLSGARENVLHLQEFTHDFNRPSSFVTLNRKGAETAEFVIHRGEEFLHARPIDDIIQQRIKKIKDQLDKEALASNPLIKITGIDKYEILRGGNPKIEILHDGQIYVSNHGYYSSWEQVKLELGLDQEEITIETIQKGMAEEIEILSRQPKGYKLANVEGKEYSITIGNEVKLFWLFKDKDKVKISCDNKTYKSWNELKKALRLDELPLQKEPQKPTAAPPPLHIEIPRSAERVPSVDELFSPVSHSEDELFRSKNPTFEKDSEEDFRGVALGEGAAARSAADSRLFSDSLRLNIDSNLPDDNIRTLDSPLDLRNLTPDVNRSLTPDVDRNLTPDVNRSLTPEVDRSLTPDIASDVITPRSGIPLSNENSPREINTPREINSSSELKSPLFDQNSPRDNNVRWSPQNLPRDKNSPLPKQNLERDANPQSNENETPKDFDEYHL